MAFYNHVTLMGNLTKDPDLRYISVTNEGEGVSIASGLWLGGKSPIMIMENSGLRVACEPLSRLGITHGIPVLMMVGYVGDIGERNWWGVAHGIVMESLLQALRIPYITVRKVEEFKDAIERAKQHIAVSLYHVVIVMTGDVVK